MCIRDSAHAALAGQRQRGLRAQVQGRAAAAIDGAALLAVGLPVNGQIRLWRPQFLRKALIFLYRIMGRQAGLGLGEGRHVEPAGGKRLAHQGSVRESPP